MLQYERSRYRFERPDIKSIRQQRNRDRYTKDERRDMELRAKFGITLEQYQYLKTTQKDCCAICRVDFNMLSRDPDVDHDHRSGAVRGLLCSRCNLMIGLARDDASILQNAAFYLRQENDTKE
jgi:hypothetical protein